MITFSIPTSRDLWRAVARFAYRRWVRHGDPKPTGIPGNRDPDAPCTAYAPRPWREGDFRDCMTDGHYLCGECCHRAQGCDLCGMPPGEDREHFCEGKCGGAAAEGGA